MSQRRSATIRIPAPPLSAAASGGCERLHFIGVEFHRYRPAPFFEPTPFLGGRPGLFVLPVQVGQPVPDADFRCAEAVVVAVLAGVAALTEGFGLLWATRLG
jgi:hypothetical protein